MYDSGSGLLSYDTNVSEDLAASIFTQKTTTWIFITIKTSNLASVYSF
jgi:hypothetical protein